MTKAIIRIVFLFLIVFSFSKCKKAATSDSTPVTTKYFPLVKTIIQNNCISCHSTSGNWSGRPTAFDTDSSIAKQLESIKASISDPVTPINKRMPQTGELSTNDINTILSWYNVGGKTSD